ncbi:DUF2207 domain-containing protein [Halalkalibacter okhensis]|uniref:DUF2207 domain-containing protein n=1 Tax=Halalkalibacter okhensis TaxID=333138 RepID=UPI000554DFB8|nr:DUF2207 domain-containing protein [Halalkalibacter okhensis]
MMNKKIFSALIVSILLFIPTQVLAVDYEITNVEIHAYLLTDGNVSVQESHTYDFSGEFGGIIREIIPKEGTEIIQLEAFEDSQPLLVETNETEHRIHRTGEDETITIDIYYEIKNGVDVYADVAEFYWPFFDRSNDSTYENLMINVYPPESTSEVIAFGYDEAFQKESVSQDGHVQYNFGQVPRKQNGDIRVAYNASLFGAATETSNELMKEEIEAAHLQLMDKKIATAERKEFLSALGAILVPLVSLGMLFLYARAWLEAKGKRASLMREGTNEEVVPKETLSMPTTIFYLNYHQFQSEAIAAALLDLVRKGHVKKIGDDKFRLVKGSGLLRHEQILTEWLFDEIGDQDEFCFDDLITYLEDKKNHQKYQRQKNMWQEAVRAELKEARLYENKVIYRVMIGLLSLILLPIIILFAVHGLVFYAVSTGILFSGFLLFAICYYPKTLKGSKITLEWRNFKQKFQNLQSSQWQTLSEDDKMRAFIYGLGINDKSIKTKNETLINAFNPSISSNPMGTPAYSFDPTWLIVAAAATSNFNRADRTTGVADSSSGGSSIGGGSGAGGGGGGSGAF